MSKLHTPLITIFTSTLLCSSMVFAADVSLGDKQFLKNAAQSDLFEMEGSKLALKKSGNNEVKAFANHVVEDHTKASNELKALAAKKGVELPTKPSLLQRSSLKLLGMYKGSGFDDSYAENIGVDAHESAVEDFSEAAEDADDAEIKAFAQKTLPTLKQHLEMAKALKVKTDNAD